MLAVVRALLLPRATFSNDSSKVLFTDERGGGTSPECNPPVGQAQDADAVYRIKQPAQPVRLGYFKIARSAGRHGELHGAQRQCAADPVREILIQAWYLSGISVIDWTDGGEIKELAWFDGGPWLDQNGVGGFAGAWSPYWHNGRSYSSEIQRGFDVLQLSGVPSLSRTSRRVP